MASEKKKVVVVLTEPQVKKNVTRYDCPEDDGALTSIYVRKDALKAIGEPAKIKVTIEAA